MTGNYAPTVVIEAPADMETDTKINATIGCSSPFNLESDMSDNSKEVVHCPGCCSNQR